MWKVLLFCAASTLVSTLPSKHSKWRHPKLQFHHDDVDLVEKREQLTGKSCDDFVIEGHSWSSGAQGHIRFDVPVAVSRWKVIIELENKPVRNFNLDQTQKTWEKENCKFVFKNYRHEKIAAGSVFEKRYSFSYDHRQNPKPKIAFIKFVSLKPGTFKMQCGTPVCNKKPPTTGVTTVVSPTTTLTPVIQPLSGDACLPFLTTTESGPGNEGGKIKFTVPIEMSTWKLKVGIVKTRNDNFHVQQGVNYVGQEESCAEGNYILNYVKAGNAVDKAGSILELPYFINYDQNKETPEIKYIMFGNDDNQYTCGSLPLCPSTEAPEETTTTTTTTTTTEAPEETTTEAVKETTTELPEETTTVAPQETTTTEAVETTTEVPAIPLAGETCLPFLTTSQSGPGNEGGQIRFTVPIEMSTWELKIGLSKSAYSFQIIQGVNNGQSETQSCGSYIYSYVKPKNTVDMTGSSLKFPYFINYDQNEEKPEIKYIMFGNDDNQYTCGSLLPCPSTEAPEETTTEAPKETTTEAPKETTTEAVKETTTEAPKETTTEAPNETTTEASKETTTEPPKETTTEAPKETTTEDPKETTTEATKETTTEAPRETTTEASKETTIEAPKETTTEAPKEMTTEDPKETTTEVPEACQTKHDYEKVLKLSLQFYKAQRAGTLPDNDIEWRRDSFTTDRSNSGKDLSGGYFDAGDFIKFNFPAAASTTMLAWGMVEFGEGYKFAGLYDEGLDMLKWATDYFIKCHTGPNELYGQCGVGGEDHASWGREDEYYTNNPGKTNPRPCFKIDAANPGSDLAGETAAALAATSMAFKYSDPTYSQTLLKHARELYAFANQFRGKYSDSIKDAAKFYNSYSGYNDELAWGAAWLYKATGEQEYLSDADNHFNQMQKDANELSWDNKGRGVAILLSQLSNQNKYLTNANSFCNKMKNDQPRTSEREIVFIQKWGSNRHAANVAFACLAHSKYTSDGDFNDFGRDQIDKLLGDDTKRSFVIGYGNNPPKQPHHRPSSCPNRPAPCGWNEFNANAPNPQTLYGALVGGDQSQDGGYVDKRSDYVSNEVALDYNAGFQSAVAALLTLQKDGDCGK